jgi:hypothetical protein
MDRPSTVDPTRPESDDRQGNLDTQSRRNTTTSRTSNTEQDPLQRQENSSASASVEMPSASSSRKRSARRVDEHSSADESAPIIRHAPQNDYQSISPSLSARGATAQSTSHRTTQQEGTLNPDPNQQPDPQARSASAERRAASVERKEGNWWRGFLEKYGSVELENKASVARDHLALGRPYTFPKHSIYYLHTYRN